jgi:hypothetical protein
MNRMTATFVSIALVVLIVFVFVYTAMQSNRARETWATVDGRIVESRVEVRSRPGAERPDMQYGAVVVYEYTVAGKRYRSGRVSFEGTAWRANRDAAEADRARYAEGAKVSVFYDPHKPGSAVLDLPVR